MLADVAHAADPRVTLLARQLAGSKDPRVRSQTLLLLGQTMSDDAVTPLCGALKDGESIVRASAANALADLATPPALSCLKTAQTDSDPSVRSAVEKGLATPPMLRGGLYLNVEPTADKVGGMDSTLVTLADSLLKQHLSTLGARFAPLGQEKKAAQALIKARALRGYQVRMQLAPGTTEKQLKVEMLILTYPDQALQGSWNVKASGGKPETLIKAMVPKVVEDAAGDLNWKSPQGEDGQ